MFSETELLYTLALQRVKNLGDASAKKLIRAVGSAEAFFNRTAPGSRNRTEIYPAKQYQLPLFS